MSDNLVTFFYLVGCIVVITELHWRVWWRSVAGFRTGSLTRASCLARVAVWQFLGLLVPVAALLLLIGIEEFAGMPLVPERIALLALGLTGPAIARRSRHFSGRVPRNPFARAGGDLMSTNG
ncbi:MAG: hypothetical protein HYX71_04510 [Opitutae bacterium]|nr:hypothetical protein [Opitutae bacterium]